MKLLIVSYNPLTLSNNGGKRMCSLLSSFSKEELIQFYVYPRLPDIKRCNSYYRLSDTELISGLLDRKHTHIIDTFESDSVTEQVPVIYGKSQKFRPLKLLLRDMLWAITPWQTEEFVSWIESEKPDCIFADTGDSCFIYNITMSIAKKYHIPVICSFGDDYYTLRAAPWNVGERLQLALLRHKIKQFVGFCDVTATINHTFTDFYAKTFGLDRDKQMMTLYTASNFDFSGDNHHKISNSNEVIFSYIGNLGLGRYENLIKIGQVLDIYNLEHATKHKLIVYARRNLDFEEKCKNCASVIYKGAIPGDRVRQAILSSDILIHTESFKPEYMQNTIYSLSTKIADSLSSGRCMLAYGPDKVASMRHLLEHDCAYCITSENSLEDKIDHLLSNLGLTEYYAERGMKTATQCHNSQTIGKMLYARCKALSGDKED